jgi:hypothetical protein
MKKEPIKKRFIKIKLEGFSKDSDFDLFINGRKTPVNTFGDIIVLDKGYGKFYEISTGKRIPAIVVFKDEFDKWMSIPKMGFRIDTRAHQYTIPTEEEINEYLFVNENSEMQSYIKYLSKDIRTFSEKLNDFIAESQTFYAIARKINRRGLKKRVLGK